MEIVNLFDRDGRDIKRPLRRMEASDNDGLVTFLDPEFVTREDQTVIFRISFGLTPLFHRHRLLGAPRVISPRDSAHSAVS